MQPTGGNAMGTVDASEQLSTGGNVTADAGHTRPGVNDAGRDAALPVPDGGSSVEDGGSPDAGADGGSPDAGADDGMSSWPGPAYPAGSATLQASAPCGDALCHDLLVTCEGPTDWGVSVRETAVSDPRGAVIFGTGGPSNTFYFDNGTRRPTRQVAIDEQLQIFEFRWNPSWIRAGEVTGDIRESHCVYAATVDWIAAQRAERPDVLCAQGNSAGSFQIAYGLVDYNLEARLTLAVMTGGPPLTRMDYACFDTDPNGFLVFPADLAGRRWIDMGMGWEAERYCQQGQAPGAIHERLRAASIVSPNAPGDYDYPQTQVHFVSSEDDIQGHFGHLYFDAISSSKDFHWIASGAIGGNPHEVDLSPAGMAEIQRLLREECR